MKTKRKGIVICTLPAQKGHWEIYASVNKKRLKPVRFKSIDGKKYEGLYDFGTRLIVRNSNFISGNPVQFNTIAGAKKNINAVKTSC